MLVSGGGVLLDCTQQLFTCKGFGQVLIRADNPAAGHIEQTVLTGEHDDGCIMKIGIVFYDGASLITVKTWHHDVDKYQVGG